MSRFCEICKSVKGSTFLTMVMNYPNEANKSPTPMYSCEGCLRRGQES